MNIYLDESGDLGWNFTRPNREGGSSRYITIFGYSILESEKKYIRRFILKIHKKYGLSLNIEKKGASFTNENARYICSLLPEILKKAPSFKLFSITVYKQNVYQSLKNDQNIFYNYVLGELLSHELINNSDIYIYPDKRQIKISDGSQFPVYIKTKLFAEGHSFNLNYKPLESNSNMEIWLSDWLANFVWRSYEDGHNDANNILKGYLGNFYFIKTMFFPKQNP